MNDTLEKMEKKIQTKMKTVFDDVENKPLIWYIKWAIIIWFGLWIVKKVKKVLD